MEKKNEQLNLLKDLGDAELRFAGVMLILMGLLVFWASLTEIVQRYGY